MIRQARLLAVVAVSTSSLALAQHNCPQSFRYAGTLAGSGSIVSEFNERREINLPQGATIDTTYQQTSVRSHGGSTTPRPDDLRAQDIPKGIHIIPYGSTDLQKGWSVSAPKLTAIELPGPEGVARYRFGMKLYCTVGSAVNQNVGSCNVQVDVCYLPKK